MLQFQAFLFDKSIVVDKNRDSNDFQGMQILLPCKMRSLSNVFVMKSWHAAFGFFYRIYNNQNHYENHMASLYRHAKIIDSPCRPCSQPHWQNKSSVFRKAWKAHRPQSHGQRNFKIHRTRLWPKPAATWVSPQNYFKLTPRNYHSRYTVLIV